jgi:hypothetical protein
MVPSADEPPALPLTDQVTEVLELPETFAVNWKELAARMLAVVGETVIDVDAGVPGLLFPPLFPPLFPDELPEPVAAQPAPDKTARIDRNMATRRMAFGTHLDFQTLRVVSAKRAPRRYWTEGKKKGSVRGEIVECRDL